MAQTYTRQSSFSDGDTITAGLFNDEYNQLVNAFSYSSSDASSTGHRHDGTAGQGGNIHTIGDLDFLNKIVVDSTNNRWGVYVEVSGSAVEQIRIQDGAIVPVTDNDIDLGTSSLEFKDLYLDGTATIDTLAVDANATVAGTLGVTGATTLSSTLAVTSTSTLTGNVTASNDLSVGGNLTVTGNATIAGNLTFGDAATDTVAFSADVASNLLPSADNTYDLGASGSEWKDLYIDGTANIDSLVADTADINAGTIDNATIGATTASTGAFTTITASSTLAVTGTSTLTGNVTASNDLSVGGNLTVTGNATIAGNLTFGDAATDTVTLSADVASNILPSADNTYDLGASGSEWKDIYIDGTAYLDAINFNGTAITSTAAELNLLDGVTATTTELNYLDVTTLGTVEASKAVTADANADVKFGDSDKLVFGAGSDLQIYHDGSNSRIKEVGTGSLLLDADSLYLRNTSGDSYFQGLNGGAANVFYNGSVKLATTSTGIDVTGVITTDGMTTSADINFGDNDKAVFGSGSDLQIYHSGSHSFINDTGTGDLRVLAANFAVYDAAGTNLRIKAFDSGATKLYDGTTGEKLSTTSTGIDVTGVITTDGMTTSADINFGDNDKAVFGAGSDLQIYHDGSNSYINDTSGTGNLYIASNQLIINNAANSENMARFVENGAATLYYDGSAKLATTSTGIDVTGTVTTDKAEIDSTTANPLVLERNGGTDANVSIQFNCATNDWYVGTNPANNFAIGTSLDQTNAPFQIDSSANVNIGVSSGTPTGGTSITGSTTGPILSIGGTNTSLTIGDITGSLAFITSDPSFTATYADGVASEIASIASSSVGGAHDLAFFTGTTTSSNRAERVRIKWDGSVGIGTGSPSELLHVQGTGSTARALIESTNTADGQIEFQNSTTTNGLFIGLSGSTSGDASIYHGDAKNILFSTNATERMRIDSSGNVGIGTSSISTSKLHLQGTTGTASAVRVESTAADSDAYYIADNDGSVWTWGIDGGASDSWILSNAFGLGTPKMTVTTGGSVGIGTTSPDYTLVVQGDANTNDNIFAVKDSDGTKMMSVEQTSNGDGRVIVYDTSGNADALIHTNGSTYFNGGNVGVGTSSPSDKLHVEGNIYLGTSGRSVYSAGSGNINFQVGTGVMLFRRNDGSNESMRIDSSGNLLVGTTSTGLSDTGIEARADGLLGATRDGNTVGIFNRLTSDGDIVDFRKDGSTVGSIGTSSNTTYIDGSSSNTGLQFGGSSLFPRDGGALADAAVDFGSASYRFKDLYLSGTANVGGLTVSGSTPTLKFTDTDNNYDATIQGLSGSLVLTADSGAEFGTESIQFNTGATERVRIDASGRVGIGTSSPTTSVLEAYNNEDNAYVAKFSQDHATGWGVLIDTDGTGNNDPALWVKNASDTIMWASQAGNLGIGTATPGSVLAISGTADDAYITQTNTQSGQTLKIGNAYSILGTSLGSFGAIDADTGLLLGTGGTERLRIDSSGNVGIGTGSPSRELEVTGTGNVYAKITAPTENDSAGLELANTGATWLIQNDDTSNEALTFDRASTEVMRIDSNGNVLVGTSSADGDGLSIKPRASGGGTTTQLLFDRANTTTEGFTLVFHNNSTLVGSISHTNSATSFNTSSDQRLKENIVDAPSASDDIDAIQVRSFDWKADGSHQKYGMVAQELVTVAPEAVSQPEDPNEMMGVDYSKLVPMLIKEVQQLRARVAQLEGEN